MGILRSASRQAAKARSGGGLRAGYKAGKKALIHDIPQSPRVKTSQQMLGRLSIRNGVGSARSTEKAMAIGSRRIKYGAATAAGLAVYGSAMSSTKYDKSYSSSGRYGLNPRSTGGFA